MSPTATALMDPDELLAMPDGDHYELVDGVPVEKTMGAKADEIALALGSILRAFVKTNRLGRTYGSQTGYRCFAHAPKLVRKPDVSFVAAARVPGSESPDGDYGIAPDFAAEVVSPNDLYEEVETKVNEYLVAGVRLIWVVSPKSRTVLVRRPDGTAAVVTENGRLSGEDVIPGFDSPAAELFS